MIGRMFDEQVLNFLPRFSMQGLAKEKAGTSVSVCCSYVKGIPASSSNLQAVLSKPFLGLASFLDIL